MRDNFTAKTVRILAERAGHLCSNPDCRKSTIGPALDEARSTIIGVAAHITAAAEGGPRFDRTLSTDERASITNGIWLCHNCHTLIDKDVDRYDVDVLKEWKSGATQRAFDAISTGTARSATGVIRLKLDDADIEFLKGLGIPNDEDIEKTYARAKVAAQQHIETFKTEPDWPTHVVSLHLSIHTDAGRRRVTVNDLARSLRVPDGLNVVSEPGTGKSTTLVEIAAAALNQDQAIPVLIPLSDWSSRKEEFFIHACTRHSFRALAPGHFMQLAYHGRLLLLLDGWNELDEASRIAAQNDIRALKRDFPLLAIVVGTRPQALPIKGPIVEIEPLTPEQQRELAAALRGAEGEKLVDQAWRTAGIRELITIPLYLRALLTIKPGEPFPRTKEELLRKFVQQHEHAPEKMATLKRELLGFHREFLVGLAVEANRIMKTSISDSVANRIVSEVQSRLEAEKQLRATLQPPKILDTLADTHMLVRRNDDAIVHFQHHQFQEWYASFWVEEIMKQARGDHSALQTLRVGILNLPAWEESILFACERLSQNVDAGAPVVADAAMEALTIDPMLAAEMIFRSSDAVWLLIKERIVTFVQRWHQHGKIDRALRFMMATGKAEFSDEVWAILSSPADLHFDVLRLLPRFRPSVLGPKARSLLSGLPDKQRQPILGEIADNSGYDGMELACEVTKTDPSPAVVTEVVQSFSFRGADGFLNELMSTAPDAVWAAVASTDYPETLPDAALNERLTRLRSQNSTKQSPEEVLSRLLRPSSRSDDANRQIEALLADEDFSFSHSEQALKQAFDRYPDAVASGLRYRLEKGWALPHRAQDYLTVLPVADDGPVVEAARNGVATDQINTAALALVGSAPIGTFIDELLALDDQLASTERVDEAFRKRYWGTLGAIAATRFEAFLPAFAQRCSTKNPRHVRLLADLLTRHGRDLSDEREEINTTARATLIPIVKDWVQLMLTSPDADRHQMSEVARVIARLKTPELADDLKLMVDKDLADRAKAREEFFKTPVRGGPIPADVTHSYNIQYRQAFVAIGDARVVTYMEEYLGKPPFRVDAAYALLNIWTDRNPAERDAKKGFPSWNDFGEVKQKRALLQAQGNIATSDFAERIFAASKSLMSGSPDEQNDAIAIATAGFGLPHGDKHQHLELLLALPAAYSIKLGLLTSAAKAGVILPAAALQTGLHELLEQGKKDTWRLDDSRGELMGWIELFAFSDDPKAVFQALEALPRKPYGQWRLERLLTALSRSPHSDAPSVLFELAVRSPELYGEHDWLNAVFRLDTAAAATAVVELLCSDRLASHYRDSYQLSRWLAEEAREYPSVKDGMLKKLDTLPAGPAKEILLRSLVEVADVEISLALVHAYVKDSRNYDELLGQALKKVAVHERPAKEWHGAYEEFGVAVTDLRKQLFLMAINEGPQAALATACLSKIDRLRDRFGRLDDEPRHPDIASGRAWPFEASSN